MLEILFDLKFLSAAPFTGLDAIALAFNLGQKARHFVAVEHIRNIAINVEGTHDGA